MPENSISVTLEPKRQDARLDMSALPQTIEALHAILNLAAGLEKNDKDGYFVPGERNYTPYSFTIENNPDPRKSTPIENPIKLFFGQGETIQDPLTKNSVPIHPESLKAWKKFSTIIDSYKDLNAINLTRKHKKVRNIRVNKEFLEKVKTLLIEDPKGTGAVIGEYSGWRNKGKGKGYEFYTRNQSSNQVIRVDLTAEQAEKHSIFNIKDGARIRAFGIKKYNAQKQLLSLELINMENLPPKKKFDYKKARALLGYRPESTTVDDLVQAIRESRA